jgi:Carboxypeptidase regulatory-like domain
MRIRATAVPRTVSPFRLWGFVVVLLLLTFLSPLGVLPSLGPTASTGALTGSVIDPSGGVVAGATVHVIDVVTGESHEFASQPNGSYLAPLLAPGTYRIEVSKTNFKMAVLTEISVSVTETHTANIELEVGAVTENMTVAMQAEILETQSQALGHVTDERMVEGLPLVTRSYGQILALSAGASADVKNAGGVGNSSE